MPFNFLNGSDGEQSSKRLFTFILIILWCVYFFANLFWGRILKETLEEYLFYLIVITFFGVAIEGWKSFFLARKEKKDADPKP